MQRIPLVVAVKDGQPVDGFLGAHPEPDGAGLRAAAAADRGGEQLIGKLIAAGDEDSLRQALELEPGNEDAVVGAGRAARRARASPRKRSACWPAIPETDRDPPGRRPRPARRRARRRLRRHADGAARPGEGRRGRPPGVRRHPRAAGPRRSAHGVVPAPAHQPTVLTTAAMHDRASPGRDRGGRWAGAARRRRASRSARSISVRAGHERSPLPDDATRSCTCGSGTATG